MRLLRSIRILCTPPYILFRHIFLDGLDNRLLAPLFGIRLFERVRRQPLTMREPQLHFGGAVRDYGHFLQCSEVMVDFNKLRSGENKGGKMSPYLESGFMRIGSMASPPWDHHGSMPLAELEQWIASPERDIPSPATTIHEAPVLFAHDFYVANAALALRQIYSLLCALKTLGLPLSGNTLLWGTVWSEKKEGVGEALLKRLFQMQSFGNMQGVHLFRNVLYCRTFHKWEWQQPEAVQLVRRQLLPAVGITPRRRSENVHRILLVRRREYKYRWGLNLVVRKISNEDEIIAALRSAFPTAEVQAVRLEQRTIEEQVRLVHQADLFIGMHGAAFGFIALLPENAAVLELFPRWFLLPNYFEAFYPLAIGAGLHYRRWINFSRKREYASAAWTSKRTKEQRWWEPKRDFTEVPPQAVVRRARALQHCICKKG